MIGETLALEPVQALIAAFTSMESRGTSLRLRILLCFCLKTCQNLRDTKLHPYKPGILWRPWGSQRIHLKPLFARAWILGPVLHIQSLYTCILSTSFPCYCIPKPALLKKRMARQSYRIGSAGPSFQSKQYQTTGHQVHGEHKPSASVWQNWMLSLQCQKPRPSTNLQCLVGKQWLMFGTGDHQSCLLFDFLFTYVYIYNYICIRTYT